MSPPSELLFIKRNFVFMVWRKIKLKKYNTLKHKLQKQQQKRSINLKFIYRYTNVHYYIYNVYFYFHLNKKKLFTNEARIKNSSKRGYQETQRKNFISSKRLIIKWNILIFYQMFFSLLRHNLIRKGFWYIYILFKFISFYFTIDIL